METTPNYSWVMPDSTDLVKDLPADFATFGNAVDSTVYSNASAAIAKTIVDAKGDLIAATAADTVARLAVGTNGQVLTADSTAATGLAWATASAGGMTLLSTTSLSGSSVTISSISGSYKQLFAYFVDVYGNTNQDAFDIRFNSDTGSNYWYSFLVSIDNAASGGSGNTTQINLGKTTNSTTTAYKNGGTLLLPNYTSTETKLVTWDMGVYAGGYFNYQGSGKYLGASAISSITFKVTTGTFTAGTVYLYGVS